MSPAEELANAAHMERMARKERARQDALEACHAAGKLACLYGHISDGAALAAAALRSYEYVTQESFIK